MNRLGPVVLCALLGGCGATPQSPPSAQPATGPEPPPFVGVVWQSTDPAAAPGTMRIFLPNGTLVMDSCGETYRLARWRSIDPRRIEWQEDTARIEAEVTLPADGQLQLRLQLAREVRTETYRLAQVPMVCPDVGR